MEGTHTHTHNTHTHIHKGEEGIVKKKGDGETTTSFYHPTETISNFGTNNPAYQQAAVFHILSGLGLNNMIKRTPRGTKSHNKSSETPGNIASSSSPTRRITTIPVHPKQQSSHNNGTKPTNNRASQSPYRFKIHGTPTDSRMV